MPACNDGTERTSRVATQHEAQREKVSRRDAESPARPLAATIKTTFVGFEQEETVERAGTGSSELLERRLTES